MTELVRPRLDDFTVPEIKGALRRSTTIQEVNATVRHFALHVVEMERKGGEWKVQAIQIKNLARYRRLCLGKGWG